MVVVLDKKKYTSADFVAHAGIPTYIDDQHAIAQNNKIMIIDRQTLITGSFNFTKAAEEKNAENLLVLKGNRALVDSYMLNFEEHILLNVLHVTINSLGYAIWESKICKLLIPNKKSVKVKRIDFHLSLALSSVFLMSLKIITNFK